MTEERPEETELVPDEELTVTDGGAARFAPVEIKSGEENYHLMIKHKAKLLRFDEGENAWKERGQGEAKILQHKESGKHVFILRRDGTGKLAAQHDLVKGISMKRHSDKKFVWATMMDFSDDEEGQPETFAISFQTKEAADEFKRFFDAVTIEKE